MEAILKPSGGMPLHVPSELQIGIDATELGAEKTATIYVIRFKAIQPFFLGAI
jgi:hypothetical protein